MVSVKFLAGAALGYLAGARAGREHYDKIVGLIQGAAQGGEADHAAVNTPMTRTATGEDPQSTDTSLGGPRKSTASGSKV